MIVYGTRGSDLARTQTTQVAEAVKAATGEDYRLEIIRTRGDAILDKPLPEIGGKGLFTAELETALRDGSIDVAIHSLKDLPVEDPEGLCLGAIPARAPVHDVLVYDPRHHDDEAGTLPLQTAPANGPLRVGTSSPRRAAALETLRKDLAITDIRGNVPTRAGKVRSGDYAAVILAAAGMHRLDLDLDGLARAELPTDRFVPAPGQGALGVQCRRDDPRVRTLLQSIHDDCTARCVTAERALLSGLDGGCSTPLGALAQPLPDGTFQLTVALFSRDGTPMHRVLHQSCGEDLEAMAATALETLHPVASQPLRGRRIALLQASGGDSAMDAWLSVAGAELERIALTEVLPVTPTGSDLERLWQAPVLALTSARAVDRLFEEATYAGIDLRERTCWAVGPTTAAALRAHGVEPLLPATPVGGARLAESILAEGGQGPLEIGFPCALGRRPELEATLRGAGHRVHDVALYRTEPLRGVEWPSARYDAMVWTSPSSVDSAHDAGDLPATSRHVAVGETTATALRGRIEDSAIQLSVAHEPSPAAVLDALQTDAR